MTLDEDESAESGVDFPKSNSTLDDSTNSDIIICMPKIEDILAAMRDNPKGVRFADACKVCDHYFGKPRQSGSSHRIYKTPWPGDPRVNIQNAHGATKAYQIKQILRAIDKLVLHENH